MKSIEKKSKTVRVIKNLHTEKEMEDKGKRFVAHAQPFLSLDDIFRLEFEKNKHTASFAH